MAEPAFKQFDVVSDHSDHHYSSVEKQGKSGDEDDSFNMSTTVYKNIMREWKILDKDLPDTIYVRVYDTRVDLLRAVLVGATGTPYRDGLFFFDTQSWYQDQDFPCRMILGGNTVMSTTVDGSATLNPPSTTKSSPLWQSMVNPSSPVLLADGISRHTNTHIFPRCVFGNCHPKPYTLLPQFFGCS